MEKIGLVAGSDELPLIFADEAAKDGKEVVAIAFRGYTSPGIVQKARTYWIESVNAEEVLEILKKEQIKSLAMEGKLPHSLVLSGGKSDPASSVLLDRNGDLQTQTILRRAAELLKIMGIEVMDARTYLEPVLCPEGRITNRVPDESEQADIEFGKSVLEKIGSADIGQLVAVKNGVVLAVEAIEGTDEAIKRGAALGGPGIVVVKTAKPMQDMRFDLPVIGERTIRTMADCGAGTLGAESGKTVLLNREEVIRLADKSGITIIGI
jgi:UDP-2,3-diacylglucosamine hydrolase